MAAALVAAFAVADDAPKAKRGRPKGRNPSGGIVEKAYAGNVIRAFNAQAVIPADKVAALTLQMRYETIVPFETVGAKPMTFAEAENAAGGFVGKDKVGAAVVIVNDPSKSDFYRASPEGRWAVLNVSPLTADNPAQERLEERFAKVYWHAVVRALGGGYAQDIEALPVEVEITPFSITDEKDTITNLMTANGNKPIVSQRESIELLGWSADVDKTMQEIEADGMRDAFEPTM